MLHSFWVPEWRIKRDLVPGELPGGDEIDDTVVVTPDVEGTYSVICTELCGIGHATMRAVVVVQSQDEFDAWVEEPGSRSGAEEPEHRRRREPRGAGVRAPVDGGPECGGDGAGSTETARAGQGARSGSLLGGGFGFGLVVALRAISGLEIFQTEQTGYPHVIVPAITGAARLPGRPRLLRLLVPLGLGRADHPRRPLPARREELAATTSSSTPITR